MPNLQPNPTTSILIAAVGLAIAVGVVWSIDRSERKLTPNRMFESLRKPQWKSRTELAGTEAAQRTLLRDAKFYRDFDLVPMKERIDMWNGSLTAAYRRGDIAKQTYTAWKDRLPV
jgi:hypothetical protein